MTTPAENQGAIRFHRWQGIASTIIGVTSVVIIMLLAAMTLSAAEPPRPLMAALEVLSTAMLCANLIGIALGVIGARDRSSEKLYPLLGLVLNVVILVTFVALAAIGLAMEAS